MIHKNADGLPLSEIEEAYSQVVSGYDEPSLMWMNGQSLMDMAIKTGKPITHDTDGNPIDPSQCYMISDKGIFLYGEDWE